MRKLRIFLAALVTLMGTSLIIPTGEARAINLVVNGGFELPDIPSGTWSVYGAIAGWNTTAGPGIEIQDNVAGSPYEGGQFVELDSYGNSAMMSQAMATTAGEDYLLSFAYSPRPGQLLNTNAIGVYFNNVLLDTLAAAGSTNTVWSLQQYTVTAVGGTSLLKFAAGGSSDSYGGYIDAVSLEATSVPEPSTMLLLGSGLLGLAGLNRRRKV